MNQTSENCQTLGINPAKGFIVGGISAGANLAIVVTHLYRDDKRAPPLTGQYLSIPPTCVPQALPEKYKQFYLSRQQNKDAPILNSSSITMFEGVEFPHCCASVCLSRLQDTTSQTSTPHFDLPFFSPRTRTYLQLTSRYVVWIHYETKPSYMSRC